MNVRFENNNHPSSSGSIEVICGSMFSGKTEELIRRLNRALIAGLKVEIFKPSIDTRYSANDVVSHNKNQIPSIPVQSAQEILARSGDSHVIGIDEAQFFDNELVEISQKLANAGKKVIIAGLDMDFKGVPFEPIPQLMSIAEYVTKVRAVCVKCGKDASYSFRLTDATDKVLLGEQDKYEARCRSCFNKDCKDEV